MGRVFLDKLDTPSFHSLPVLSSEFAVELLHPMTQKAVTESLINGSIQNGDYQTAARNHDICACGHDESKGNIHSGDRELRANHSNSTEVRI